MEREQNTTSTPMLQKLGVIVESDLVQKIIIGLILLNALTLGLETNSVLMKEYGQQISFLDNCILSIFVIEILIKLGYRKLSFFKDGWNIFDFIIIGIALAPATGSLSVLRTLRIFRAMRLLSVVPSMKKVTQALLSAIPGILSVGSIILLIFYVSAVLATNFFGDDFDTWFGNIGRSMFSLFQIMTLESWSMGIVRPVMELFPWAWTFFVPFILVTSFAVLNLFIGIIVDAMQSQNTEKENSATEAKLKHEASLQKEMSLLRKEIKELNTHLKK
jgi:voltage-gated sodium channel|tara:strand:- start:4278 stop:5102 length:825 start_codon:yes stop_codon:yes gene_type:complete